MQNSRFDEAVKPLKCELQNLALKLPSLKAQHNQHSPTYLLSQPLTYSSHKHTLTRSLAHLLTHSATHLLKLTQMHAYTQARKQTLTDVSALLRSVRVSALSRFGVLYIMTHDSIGLGEDGPTHQVSEWTVAAWWLTGLAHRLLIGVLMICGGWFD